MFGFLFKRGKKADNYRPKPFWIYAGEFLLVFLGILVALQVENWNQDRQDRKLERVLLEEMLSNLKTDLEDIEYNTRMEQQYLNSCQVVLDFLQSELPWHDSLGRYFARLLGGAVFDCNNSAYESLNSIGLDLIRNDSLRKQITLVYTARYSKVEKTQEILFKHILDHLYPSIRANLKTITPREEAIPVNLANLKQNNSFIEDLIMTIFTYRLSISTYVITSNAISELIEDIEKELS